MQLRYVFSELGQGLRRNLSMHLAVVLTLFVSLTLVGFGVLLQPAGRQGRRAVGLRAPDHGVPLQRPRRQPGLHRRGHRAPRRRRSRRSSRRTPRSPTTASSPRRRRSRRSRSSRPGEVPRARTRRPPPRTCPQSVWITLKDPERVPTASSSAIVGLDGVSHIRDQRETRRPDPRRAQGHAARVGARHRRVPGPRGAAAGRQHDPAGGLRAPHARSASCAWSAPRRSTSRCRSSSRRW